MLLSITLKRVTRSKVLHPKQDINMVDYTIKYCKRKQMQLTNINFKGASLKMNVLIINNIIINIHED